MSSRRFALLAALVTVSGFAGGIVAGRVSSAKADARPTTAFINVPSEGLYFRGPDGKIIARLAGESGGGVFELYNDKEQPASRMKAGDVKATPVIVPVPPAVRRYPLMDDVVDPWVPYPKPAERPTEKRPGAGFDQPGY
jgi:hypothetical protein